MDVGERLIRDEIKCREEAQRLFAQARTEGRVAALLDQERPNLFTQSVTNILPGATVKVVISYVETLPYENGVYEFTFPMVAGPRYIPGEPTQGEADGDHGVETDSYQWDANGKLNAATITLGDKLNSDYPSGDDYPITSSLRPGVGESDLPGKTIGATKLR